MARPKSITTPAGIAVWPHLHAPDTKFKAEGKYHTKLDIPLSEAQDLIAQLEQWQQDAYATAKADEKNKGRKIKLGDLPMVIDDENQVARFTFSMTASGTSKKDGKQWTMAPALFDAKGNRLPADTRIGAGSKLKVAFEPNPFFTVLVGASVSLKLRAVQVIDLQQFGGGSASSFGFGQEEGFSSTEDADENGFANEEPTPTQPAGNGDF